jgi:hypothetical protein
LHSEGEDFIGPPLRVPSLQTANDFLRQSHGRSKDITDTHNASDRPWNRPTKADVSKDWWFDLGGQYWDSPGVTFPERETVAVLMMKFAEMPIPRLALTVFMLAFLLMLVV